MWIINLTEYERSWFSLLYRLLQSIDAHIGLKWNSNSSITIVNGKGKLDWNFGKFLCCTCAYIAWFIMSDWLQNTILVILATRKKKKYSFRCTRSNGKRWNQTEKKCIPFYVFLFSKKNISQYLNKAYKINIINILLNKIQKVEFCHWNSLHNQTIVRLTQKDKNRQMKSNGMLCTKWISKVFLMSMII